MKSMNQQRRENRHRAGLGRKMMLGVGGVLIAGAIYIGTLLDGFFGFGVGGSGTGDGERQQSQPADAPNKASNVQVPQPKPTETDTEQPGDRLGDVVNVLIDGDQYKLLRSSDAPWYDKSSYEPVPLERIVELSEQVEGDSGVKIRIALRGNADSRAEEQLKKALLDSGLDPTAINWREQTVP